MNKALAFCTLIIFITSCQHSDIKPKHLVYKNIIILSDLSSRLDNRPQKDTHEIHNLVSFFKNECVKPGRKIGDRSSIYFSSFSDKIIASIDLNKIKNIHTKQQFVNSEGKYKNNGLNSKIIDFENKVRHAYSNIRNDGLDLISILEEKIKNESIIKKDTFLTNGIDSTFISFENHIYIFTDGYLEYRNKDTNNQYYFGTGEINKVRQFCKENNTSIKDAIKINNSLSLQANKSDKNKLINLHVFETHERDKNNKLQTYLYPTGQRDNEILEAVWYKWAIESGFKSFEWKKY